MTGRGESEKESEESFKTDKEREKERLFEDFFRFLELQGFPDFF